MTSIVPTLGRVVLYRLSRSDAEKINRRRQHARDHMSEHIVNSNGVMVHVGNDVGEGQIFPAIVVATLGRSAGQLHQYQGAARRLR